MKLVLDIPDVSSCNFAEYQQTLERSFYIPLQEFINLHGLGRIDLSNLDSLSILSYRGYETRNLFTHLVLLLPNGYAKYTHGQPSFHPHQRDFYWHEICSEIIRFFDEEAKKKERVEEALSKLEWIRKILGN